MAFPPDFLDEIRLRVPLSGIVGRRVNLVKKGREWEGLCPFHVEKTPSFHVNDEKGVYSCFGCGAKGNLFSFVLETENLSFPEAVELLAGEAGLAVPRRTAADREQADRRQRLFTVMDEACTWFRRQLDRPEGRDGLAYLRRRGLADRTIERFRLGFAPDGRDRLKAALTARGHGEQTLLDLGLLGQPKDGRASYDYFRGRVIYPIADRRGRIIGFGGRTLGDGQPKYLNSPETILFHKKLILFGLDAARSAAQSAERIIVAEGYMDVIALHQAGFVETVAPLGTALTGEQIAELWRVAPRAILCFDGDKAGRRAAFRAAERAVPLLAPGKTLRFAGLPDGQDPDDLVRSRGASAFARALDKAVPLDAVLWQMTVEGQPDGTPEERAALKNRLRDAVARIGDKDVAREYRLAFDRRAIALFDEPLFDIRAASDPRGAAADWPDGRWRPDARRRDRHGGGDGGAARNPTATFLAGYRGGFDGGRSRRWRLESEIIRQAGRLSGRDRKAYEAGYAAGYRDGDAGRYRASQRQDEWHRGGRNRPAPAALPGREQLLLLLAVNFPKLALDHEEAFGRLRMPPGPLTDLHRAIVAALDGEASVDSAGLKRHLNDSGFGSVLESLGVGAAYVHAAFAHPDAGIDRARDGWRDIMASLARHDALAEAAADMATASQADGGLDPEAWERQAGRLTDALRTWQGGDGTADDGMIGGQQDQTRQARTNAPGKAADPGKADDPGRMDRTGADGGDAGPDTGSGRY